jgi:NADPH-dependent curcumin reductase CurA
MRMINRQVLLKSRPDGIPQAEHFELVKRPLPPLTSGQIRVRNLYLSVEPAMRGWVNAAANYSEPVALGEVMRSFAAGVIDASEVAELPVGTWVTGAFGWQDYATVAPSDIGRVVRERDLPLSLSLGVLGINGATAHYGLLRIARPEPGETVVVSTAAGAVGSCVGQIARLQGCRAIGITGGETKRRLCLDRFRFDAAVDYKASDFADQLANACTNGVDIYFDNTAGEISDAVFTHLNRGARIIVCGTASIATWDPPPLGPRVERHLLIKRATMRGFVIFDHKDCEAAAHEQLSGWVRSGQLRYVEDVLNGLEHAPDAIAGLYRGENLGRRLIKLGDATPDERGSQEITRKN